MTSESLGSTNAVRCAVVVFTRDLRVRDHPALASAAAEADRVVPVFVLDETILGGDFARPNRLSYLCDALADLDQSLRHLGSRLIVRRGGAVAEVVRLATEVAADTVHLSTDASAYARSRQRQLERACAAERIGVRAHGGITVVAPGSLTPSGGDHFKVFTPYFRRWITTDHGAIDPTPSSLPGLHEVDSLDLPRLADLSDGSPSPKLLAGGETEARRRMAAWMSEGIDGYNRTHDDLAATAGTSKISADVHFGCLSPRELVAQAPTGPGGEAFVRQLCWRDFHHQVLAAAPTLATEDYRTHHDHWRGDEDDLDAWKQGRTGIPLVDAGMRQLAREGWMHNRARLVTASFLTKDLYLDWRLGAAHFWDQLVDGDLANNAGNWQWVAGTGNDSRPNRVLNPHRQAERFDPDGHYVRRYVDELAGIEGRAVHRPWDLSERRRAPLDYPEPLVDHYQAAAEFRARRTRP